jgi:serine/threonine protein kinase
VVAIKKIQCGPTESYRFKYILREVQILRKLSKMPGNVFTTKLLDIVVPIPSEDGTITIFLVMSFVDQDLTKVLKVKNFSEEHMIIIFYNLLCALQFLHSANIMHRDIKPGNILVTKDCQIKICDFGLS